MLVDDAMMTGLLAHAPLETPMPRSETATLLRNIDQRVANLDQRVAVIDQRVAVIEQILPTLPTQNDVKADLERFATKEDLLEEGERSRRYMKMLSENILDRVNSALDGQIGHTRRLDEHDTRLDGNDAAIGAIDLRVTAIERPGGRRR